MTFPRLFAAAAVLVLTGPEASVRASVAPSAATAIRDAVAARMGAGAQVTVISVDGANATEPVREARPDPSARLGHPIRFTLIPESGRAVLVTASVRVIGDHVVVARAIPRGATIDPADVELRRGELTGTPIRALPTLNQVTGARALRPIPAGAIMLPGFVALPRAVEAGDRVVVLAAVGAVQVTATFIASDGGAVGDVIRVMNPDTRRYVRGRIVRKGLVEVIYEK